MLKFPADFTVSNGTIDNKIEAMKMEINVKSIKMYRTGEYTNQTEQPLQKETTKYKIEHE